MGSTISTAKKVAAFQSAKGNTFYCLFEQTYESNVSPKTPHWSCVGFGDLQVAMERIFSAGSACEGGMLRYRGGSVLPENYIAAWLREMANPSGMADVPVELSVSGSFYSTWSEDGLQERKDALLALGMGDIVARLEQRERVRLSLYENAELLAELVKNHGVSHWRLLSINSVSGISGGESHLAYAPEPVKAPMSVLPAAMRLDENNYLLQNEEGSWYGAGWAYSIVGDYIRNVVMPAELASPGRYKKMIKAMRDHLEAAPALAQDMTVTISKATLDRNPWWLKQVRDKFTLLPASDGGAAIGVPYPFVGEAGEWYALSRLDKDDATWSIGLPQQIALPMDGPKPEAGTVFFETEPVKIGNHQWKLVVLEDEYYGPVTQFQFRSGDAGAPWCSERKWPTWDGNLANAGMPESLGPRLFQPYEKLVKEALKGVSVALPQLSLF